MGQKFLLRTTKFFNWRLWRFQKCRLKIYPGGARKRPFALDYVLLIKNINSLQKQLLVDI